MTKSASTSRVVGNIMLFTVFSFSVYAADFRSVSSGNWHQAVIWEINLGGVWQPATAPPDANSGRILVSSGHIVQLNQSVQMDEVEVYGRLDIGSGVQLSHGTASQILHVLSGGVVWNQGDFPGDPLRVVFEDGSRYIHAWTISEGRLPRAAWSQASVVQISGYTSAAAATVAGNWNQSFGNVMWETPSLLADFQLSGFLTDIRGDLVISNTRGNVLRLTDNADAFIRIGGNLEIRDSARFSVSRTGPCKSRVNLTVGGDMIFSSQHPLGSRFCEQGISVFQVAGSFRMTNGLLYFSSGSGGTSNSGADLRIKRDFLLLGGVLDASVAYSNRVGDVFFDGNVPQVFRRTGQVVGSFHYHLVAGSRVEIDDGHSFWGSTLEVGDLNGGATLLVRSTDSAGAIQKGQAGGGNIQVRTQFWRSGSQVIYGGSKRQFISSDHPSVTGVHTRIDNPSGVEVSAAGSTVICSGDLEVFRGNLYVSRRYLTVRGRLVTLGGRVLVDADLVDAPVGLTVDGTLAPAAGFPVVFAGSRDTNAGNAILYLNGNLSGDGLLEFVGPNTQLVIGGSFRILDRRLPVSGQVVLESLTIESAAGLTMLEVDQPLEVGNWSSSAGFTGGVFLKGGMLRMHAPLVMSSVCVLTGGILDFRGQSVELMRNIQVSPPSGVFMSDGSSTLRVSSSFAGTDNSIAFAGSANKVGVLELNRSADVTAVGNIRITPHLRLMGSLSVMKQLILTDGELLHDGGLNIAPGALLIRTPHAAFANGSPTPSGGPYRLAYADGKSPMVLRTGPESAGNISSLRMDVLDSVIISGLVAVRDSLWMVKGRLHNPSGGLLLAFNAGIYRQSEAIFTGAVPSGEGYSVIYSGSSLVSGSEADGAVLRLVCTATDTLRIVSPVHVEDLIDHKSGVMVMETDTVYAGNLSNRSVLLAPSWLRLRADFDQRGQFHNRLGTVEFSGRSSLSGVAEFHHLVISGMFQAPPVLSLTGDFAVYGQWNPAEGLICFMGQSTQSVFGDSVISINRLKVGGFRLEVKSPVRIRSVVEVSAGSELNLSDGLVTLEATDGVSGARFAPLLPSAGVSGSLAIDRVVQPADGFRYLAPPLSGSMPSSFIRDVWAKKIQAYQEATPGNRNLGFFGWPANTALESGRGYAVLSYGAAAGLTLFWRPSGRLLSGASRGYVPLPVSRTWSGPSNGYEDGWNLVGNPYPAPIYWSASDSAWMRKNISNTVIVPKPSGLGYYYYDPIRRMGDLPDGCIGIGQGFWTFAYGADPQLVVSESAKLKPEIFMRSTPDSVRGDLSGYIRLRVGGVGVKMDTTEFHQLFLIQDARTTARFEGGWDVPIFPVEGPQVVLMSEDGVPLTCYTADHWPAFIPLRSSSGDRVVLMSADYIGTLNGSVAFIDDTQTGNQWRLEVGRWIAMYTGNGMESRYRLIIRNDQPQDAMRSTIDDKPDSGQIYPNPVRGEWFQISAGQMTSALVSIWDGFGRLLSQQLVEADAKGNFRAQRPNGLTGIAVVEVRLYNDETSTPTSVTRKQVTFLNKD